MERAKNIWMIRQGLLDGAIAGDPALQRIKGLKLRRVNLRLFFFLLTALP